MENEKSALEQLIKEKLFSFKDGMDRKTTDLLFDSRTLKAIYEIMGKLDIDYIDYPISTGKESGVFKAYVHGKPIAVKIYKMSTLKFGKIETYIRGDYRFAKEKLTRGNVVYVWAKKEFTNLSELRKAGVLSPLPIGFHKNILAMGYIGTRELPAPILKDADFDPEKVFVEVVRMMADAYRKANLVHADLSEYNMLYYRKKVYFIDVGQAVNIKHPSSEIFLRRDIFNVCTFFKKYGVESNPLEVYSTIVPT
ncbi:serine protein kinase RIO [Oxyplasma meridianum]|uniref:non-specific serine/threonine protein kinase n=1 Tax=Oxyplasma meridianum TaxID=3073602 RepID=A0AAX4NEQ1_9ARCH